MTEPAVKTILDDRKNSGVIYCILAYRPVTKAEVVQTVRVYLSSHKPPKRGSTITIRSLIGYDE